MSPIDKKTIRRAITLGDVDFEDCVQYLSADVMQADVIVTRDPKGFVNANITVQSPDEFLYSCNRSWGKP